MRGIVYTGEGVEVTDALEVRTPGPNEVRIQIQAAGVCHSDLSVIDGTIPFPAPAVLGHEGAGVVESVGDAVKSVKPGDHVVIATLASCGTCRACGTLRSTRPLAVERFQDAVLDLLCARDQVMRRRKYCSSEAEDQGDAGDYRCRGWFAHGFAPCVIVVTGRVLTTPTTHSGGPKPVCRTASCARRGT